MPDKNNFYFLNLSKKISDYKQYFGNKIYIFFQILKACVNKKKNP